MAICGYITRPCDVNSVPLDHRNTSSLSNTAPRSSNNHPPPDRQPTGHARPVCPGPIPQYQCPEIRIEELTMTLGTNRAPRENGPRAPLDTSPSGRCARPPPPLPDVPGTVLGTIPRSAFRLAPLPPVADWAGPGGESEPLPGARGLEVEVSALPTASAAAAPPSIHTSSRSVWSEGSWRQHGESRLGARGGEMMWMTLTCGARSVGQEEVRKRLRGGWQEAR